MTISLETFHQLRLSHFYDLESVEELETYEFLDEIWVGELSGFNTCLQLQSSPYHTTAVSLDFTKEDAPMARRILEQLQIRLHIPCQESELIALFGEPIKRMRLAKDTQTLDFILEGEEPFFISCTLHYITGLMYIDLVQNAKIVQRMQDKKRKKSKKLSSE